MPHGSAGLTAAATRLIAAANLHTQQVESSMFGTFLASELRLLLRVLELRRIEPEGLLREAGIDPKMLERPRARCPVDKVGAAWRLAVERTGDADLGLELAGLYRPTDFHGLAIVFLASNDLRTGLERYVRYHAVVNSALKLRLERDDDRVSLVCDKLPVNDVAERVMEDSRASIVTDLCRTAISGTLDPASVSFTYEKPTDRRAHERYFRCRLLHGQAQWKLTFRSEDLERPFLASNRDLARSNDRVLEEMLLSLGDEDLVSRVKRCIVDELPSGAPSETQVAKQVSLSERSLQRKLAARGTSFTSLVAAVRRHLGERYVDEAKLPLTEVGYMLGFSDLSSFSRAFKRWTGTAPAARRQRIGRSAAAGEDT